MNLTAYVVRAFCHNSLGGNPAGVVIMNQETRLSPVQMQSVATKLNFSETVFISKDDSHSYKALYFTPTEAIDFCGHATLAAFGVLKKLRLLSGSTYPLETPAGKCEVVMKEHLIFLSQLLPVFSEEIAVSDLTPIFGEGIVKEEPHPRVISTGLRDIFVCVSDLHSLGSLKPDLTLMSELNRKTKSIGMHVFSLNLPGSKITAHCRNFAPLWGIPEESATGSSNGALACHLFDKGLLSETPEQTVLFRQGESLNEPSDIYVYLKSQGKIIERVECGGEVIIDGTTEIEITP